MRPVAILSAIPAQLIQGDRYDLRLTVSDFPASGGWSLRFSVAGQSVDAWVSTPDGDAHALTLPATETALLTPGTYRFALRAEKAGGYATTVTTGTLSVTADLAQAAAGEFADYWEQLKAAAEAALLALMDGGGVQMVTILGRQTMFRSPADCEAVIARCEARLAARRGTFGTAVRFDVVGMR